MRFQTFTLRVDKLVCALKQPRLRKALMYYGVLAGVEHQPVLQNNFRTIVDLGANRGQFALAARIFCPNARVFSFEPLAKPAEIFRQVFKGDAMVRLYQAAIGPEPGCLPIHVTAADDSSSFLLPTPLNEHLFPGAAKVREEGVKVGRLSDFISIGEMTFPAMLKLDVQGFELKALVGCEDMIEGFSHIYAECSFISLYEDQPLADEIMVWLAERNYLLKGIYNMSYDNSGNAIQGDLLFLNRNSARTGHLGY